MVPGLCPFRNEMKKKVPRPEANRQLLRKAPQTIMQEDLKEGGEGDMQKNSNSCKHPLVIMP